jgi:hypothetical protein
MKELEQEFMNVAEVVLWGCLRDPVQVKKLETTYKDTDKLFTINLLTGLRGLVANNTRGILDKLNENLQSGEIVAYGEATSVKRIVYDLSTEGEEPLQLIEKPLIPVEHWKYLKLTEESIADNCIHKPTLEERKKNWQRHYDFSLGREAGGEYPEMPPEDASWIDARMSAVGALPDWQNIRFRSEDIQELEGFEPCREDEPLWNPNEVVGYMALGYPLPVGLALYDKAEKRVANKLNEIRKKLQSGELSAARYEWGTENRREEVSALDFAHLTIKRMQHYSSNYFNLEPRGLVPISLEFKSADVRRLWPPVATTPVDAVKANEQAGVPALNKKPAIKRGLAKVALKKLFPKSLPTSVDKSLITNVSKIAGQSIGRTTVVDALNDLTQEAS